MKTLAFVAMLTGMINLVALAQGTPGYVLKSPTSEVAVGKVFQISIQRPEGSSECGLALDYGDGESKMLRFPAKQAQLQDTHTYDKPGGYKVVMGGKLQLQGLSTALPCFGADRELILNARDFVAGAGTPAVRSAAGPSARSAGLSSDAPNLPAPVSSTSNGKRVALVIGNSAYKSGPLTNPVNDARAIAAKLRKLGFVVLLRENVKVQEIGSIYREFRSAITPGGEALFFYAGHGIQFKGQNYFPAVDSVISSEEDVPLQSLNMGSLLDNMEEGKARVSLVLLDACRDNPYARSFRSGTRGLAKAEAASGTLIHYATKPGSVASDGAGKNGVYTESLLAQMDTPGLPIELMLKRVTNQVVGQTQGKQEPWVEGSLRGDFFFNPVAPKSSPPPVATPAPVATSEQATRGSTTVSAPAAESVVREDTETPFWNEVKSKGTRTYYEAYVKQYPKGKYVALARIELRNIADQDTASKPPVSGNAPASATASSIPVPIPVPPKHDSVETHPGKVFKDCKECPEMVVVPTGSFQMGGNDVGDDAKPVHAISVRGFASGRYPVTKAEFAVFVRAKNYKTEAEQGDGCYGWEAGTWKKSTSFNWRNVGFTQGEDHPVVCVTWNDAQAYALWVSQSSGKTYRLLSESEREYSTRAGTQTAYSWAGPASHEYANYGKAPCCGPQTQGRDRWEFTAPVGQFPANAFGLFDMHGNVWDWVQDWYHDNYNAAPTDASAWEVGGEQKHRVRRGGSWFNDAPDLRSASRGKGTPSSRDCDVGFRVARSMP